MGIVPHSFSDKTKVKTSNPGSVGYIKKNLYGEPPLWSLILTLVVTVGGAFCLFYFVFIDYCEDKYPSNRWIQYELYTAFWFAILGLCLLIRYFFTFTL